MHGFCPLFFPVPSPSLPFYLTYGNTYSGKLGGDRRCKGPVVEGAHRIGCRHNKEKDDNNNKQHKQGEEGGWDGAIVTMHGSNNMMKGK